MKPSSPPVTLSSGLIEQIDRVALEQLDIEAMAYEWVPDSNDVWPYNQIDTEK
jgi:hypothetical protein